VELFEIAKGIRLSGHACEPVHAFRIALVLKNLDDGLHRRPHRRTFPYPIRFFCAFPRIEVEFVPVALVGIVGNGQNVAARQVFEALSLKSRPESFGHGLLEIRNRKVRHGGVSKNHIAMEVCRGRHARVLICGKGCKGTCRAAIIGLLGLLHHLPPDRFRRSEAIGSGLSADLLRAPGVGRGRRKGHDDLAQKIFVPVDRARKRVVSRFPFTRTGLHLAQEFPVVRNRREIQGTVDLNPARALPVLV